MRGAFCTARVSVTRLGSGSAAARQRCMPPRRTTAIGSRPPLPSQASSLGRVRADPSDEAAAHLGVQTGAPAGHPGRNSGDWRGAGLHEWWRAQGGCRAARHGKFLVFIGTCSVTTAASSCLPPPLLACARRRGSCGSRCVPEQHCSPTRRTPDVYASEAQPPCGGEGAV